VKLGRSLAVALLASSFQVLATTTPAHADDALAKYYSALEQMKLIDVGGGTLDTLRRDLGVADDLLRDGTYTTAAVALYNIVESPRYSAFTDFVEYQNAEYDLSVALSRAGSYGAAMTVIEAIIKRGPSSPYWGPAHRRAVDIAIDTRDHAGVLARLEAIKQSEPIPVPAAGERAYLRGRGYYDAGKLTEADGELQQISKKSRLYSSAVYLRGVIKARLGDLKASAEAMCEIAGTEDNSKYTFAIDDRYFTVKDLARLGLGRLAHEAGEYDDAYYHYFQIPEDSQYLPDALFEASWSMYQKRELATSRDLVAEFLKSFPSSPLWPEASLLAGYVELADCKFVDSQKWYDELVAKLTPVVSEIDKVRKDPELRRQLFARALVRWRDEKATGKTQATAKASATASDPLDAVVALLKLDPKFVRLNEAVSGAQELAHGAPETVRLWQSLGSQVAETKVAKLASDRTPQQDQLADASALLEDIRRLQTAISEQHAALAQAAREGTIAHDAADQEEARLDDLRKRAGVLEVKANSTADTAAKQVVAETAPTLKPMLEADLGDARRLDKASHTLANRLGDAGEALAQLMVERLYSDTRRVLDKAKLGKVDAIIGQKRKLDIQVQDLAAGRFPEELIGRLWNASMIHDDEEYWPFEGEFWVDEYTGWR
jgi:TolA-binding protein